MAPPQQQSSNEYPDPSAFFAQLMSGLDPSRSAASGQGVDHNAGGADAQFPTVWPGFPFRPPPAPPAPPGPPDSDHPQPPSPPTPPAPEDPPSFHHPHWPGRHRHQGPPGAWGWGGPGASWFMNDNYGHFHDGNHHGHHHRGRHGRRGHRHSGDEDGTRENPAPVSDNEKTTNSADEKEKPDTSKNEKSGSPDTMKQDEDFPDPDEMVPEYEDDRGRSGFGHGGRRGRGGFGGRGCGRGGRGGHGRHNFSGGWPFNAAPGGGAGCRRGPPPAGDFNFPDMMRGFMSHPFLQHMGAAARNYAGGNESTNNDVDTFSPPVDVFNTPRAYVLHVAVPGVKREDIGVNWDPENSTLSVSGVVHRPGDEEFLKTLHSAERRVGVFEKKIVLPPRDLEVQQPKEEIDADGIAAKLDDGVLVIMVPKMEKEWTEVRKVDIL